MRGTLPQTMRDVSNNQWGDVGLMWTLGIGALFAACIWTMVLLVRDIVFLPVTIPAAVHRTYLWCRECYRTFLLDRYDYSD